MAGLALHHVYVLSPPGAPAADRIAAAGFTESEPNTHPGQGTANRRFFFQNGMLELLFVTDEAEVRSPTLRRLGLWERSFGASAGAAPLGACLRPLTEDGEVPFPTWDYRPAYLPPGMSMAVATSSEIVAEPLLFVLPGTGGAGRETVHPSGAREITSVTMALRLERPPSEALRAVCEAGLLTIVRGPEPWMEVTLDGGRSGQRLYLRDEVALVLGW